jgi:hypothetical protein
VNISVKNAWAVFWSHPSSWGQALQLTSSKASSWPEMNKTAAQTILDSSMVSLIGELQAQAENDPHYLLAA